MTTAAEKSAPVIETSSPEKRRALGRGLDSLLPAGPRVVAGTAVGAASNAATTAAFGHSATLPAMHAQAADGVTEIALDLIDANPYQTRELFDEMALVELSLSIQASGVVQPIVVRQGANGRYVLILGERRCRASKMAGKTTIPAIVRSVSDQQAAEMTVIENLQRQDLNCMEQSAAFARLSLEFKLTQEQIGKRVGMSRESVANYMRLLKLPRPVQDHLGAGRLGFSEARVLLQLDDSHLIARIAETAVSKRLSVAQLETLVERSKSPSGKQGAARWLDPNVRAVEDRLHQMLGVRVRIRDRKGKGKIILEYATLDDFDRVLDRLEGKK